jgi:hypothetical protein
MVDGDDSRLIPISEARLERVTDAIALASAGAFDDAILHIEGESSDQLGVIEEALRTFLGELKEAKGEGELARRELVSAVVREGADISRWVFIGDIDADEIRRLLAQQAAAMAGCAHVLALVDMTRAGKISADTRKAGAEGSSRNLAGAAIVGASFHLRVLARLVIQAGALFRKARPGDVPVRFFETSGEALEWFAERRAEVLKQRA